jgi:hypothetical protein
MQARVAEVKQAIAQNKQALAQYTWVEQATIILKGEQKKQEHFQVRLDPDGKPQKQSLDPPVAPSEHEGRLKKHIVEKKTEEYKEYADQIKALIQQYVPPKETCSAKPTIRATSCLAHSLACRENTGWSSPTT